MGVLLVFDSLQKNLSFNRSSRAVKGSTPAKRRNYYGRWDMPWAVQQPFQRFRLKIFNFLSVRYEFSDVDRFLWVRRQKNSFGPYSKISSLNDDRVELITKPD